MSTILLLFALLAPGVTVGHRVMAREVKAATAEWPSYGGDKASSKYSPLAQVDATNFQSLKVAWTWRSPDEEVVEAHPGLATWVWESTPLMVGGVLYVRTSLSQVAAIDAATGKTRWVYDPETWKNGTPPNNGFVHRGVADWADGDDRRILIGTGDGYLICLDAKAGKPIPAFGQGDRSDLTQGLGRTFARRLDGVPSPPMIVGDVVVMGSKVDDVPLAEVMPPGEVRGFDVRTGEQRWHFRSIPGQGEFGNETWEEGSWKTTGSANVWTLMSADESLGFVYLPFSTPSNDNYGGKRPGDGLFGESLVCLDALTGGRVWHFRMVHHELWDYDPPAAPNLIETRVNGQPVKAVAQVSKQGFAYVLDRATGRPIWPIEERAVPQSTVPGERSSPTQPFPTRPAAFDRQGMEGGDVTDFTPELHEAALSALEKYNHGPLYTPPPSRGGRPGRDGAGRPALEAALRANHRHRHEHGRPPIGGSGGRPRPEQSRPETARPPPPLGRATRSFVLLAKKLLACDKATGNVVGEVTLPRNATGSPMTYMLDGKQFLVATTGGANLTAELVVLALP